MRPALRMVLALAFTGALIGAAVMTASGSAIVRRHAFSHHYPPDRATFERPKVHGHAPLAAWKDTLRGTDRADTFAALARILPRHVLRRVATNTWLLTIPVDVVGGARVSLSGGTLELAPGSFLQARAGGRVTLRELTVTGVDAAGRSLTQPVPSRGFLVGRDGGRLILAHDRIDHLGHLGVYSYGVALRLPGPGSRITGCTIDSDYFGVYLSHAVGVLVSGNTISNSTVYGIDPYGFSQHVTIVGNVVTNSGLHGIVLADHVSGSRVLNNVVRGAGGHGIVLYRGSSGNLVSGNVVRGSFDGIVLTEASRNTLTGNRVGHVVRFGLRISGASNRNLVTHNAFVHALLGAYLYGGASGNRLLNNIFAGNRENVRVRSDAPHNIVRPAPSLSEGVR